MTLQNTAPLVSLILVLLHFHPESISAQDGVFSDAQTLGQDNASLSVQSAIYTEAGNEAMLILRGAYGLSSGLTFHGKVGLLRNDTYLGANLEYQLAGEPYDPVSLSMLAGVYTFGNPGIKLGGIMSKQLGQFSLFSGLTFEPLFADSDVRTPLLVPIGFEVPLGRSANIVMEADIAANDDADLYQALHLGINLYF